MNSKIIILLITLCTGFFSPAFAQKTIEVESPAGYTVKLPDYMSAATGLNDEASLQYQNLVKETYLIVIDESKKEFVDVFVQQGLYDENLSTLENFASAQAASISGMMTLKSKSGPVESKINGMKAREYEFTGRVEGIEFDITYFVVLIEGAEKLYTVMSWTMAETKDKYRDDLMKASRSLKEKK